MPCGSAWVRRARRQWSSRWVAPTARARPSRFLTRCSLPTASALAAIPRRILLRYNERVRVLGEDASDAALIDAFERIEAARLDIALTYFEFGTLAALWIFSQSKLDVAVLEVGLGGRLDAVNIIDADAAIVTTIDLDHQDWLGNDRDSIGREKAGIFRAAAAGGDRHARGKLGPAGRRTSHRRAHCCAPGPTIASRCTPAWLADGRASIDLPAPTLAAPCQIDNAAAAIAALYSLRERLGWNPAALIAGVGSARAAARLQRMHKPGAATIIIDVAHNPQAAGVLGAWLRGDRSSGRTVAVFGALADKDVAGIVAPLAPHIAHWYLSGLDADTPRGLPAADLHSRVLAAAPGADITAHANVVEALTSANAQAGPHDRILAFGSFFVAAAALLWAQRNGWSDS